MNLHLPESVGMSPARLARIDAASRKRIERGELAGIATMVARKGRLVHFSVQGVADRERGRPLQQDTIYHIYSMSKPVTTVALLTLFEEGMFQLDDPVSALIPEFNSLKVLARMSGKSAVLEDLQRPITFRHLFTHTSGLCYPSDAGTPAEKLLSIEMGGVYFRESPLTLAEWIKRLVRAPLAHQPGTAWTYGFSIDVLGRLVEILSGLPFDVFLRNRIFDPLGMSETGFSVPEAKQDRIAVVYGADSRGSLEPVDWACTGYGLDPVFMSGGGGLYSTAPDYLRFAQMLVNGGELDGARILGRRTVNLMATGHIPQLMDLPSIRDGSAFGIGCTYGLGGRVLVTEYEGLSGSPGTYGWDGLAGTTFFVDPAEDLTALFFTQITPWPPALHQQFRTLVYQAL